MTGSYSGEDEKDSGRTQFLDLVNQKIFTSKEASLLSQYCALSKSPRPGDVYGRFRRLKGCDTG